MDTAIASIGWTDFAFSQRDILGFRLWAGLGSWRLLSVMESDQVSAKCLVCGKEVATTDQQEHLATNHLGPHYFWFDAKKHRTMKPSMLVSELKRLVGASAIYPVFEERGDELIGLVDGQAVDLTREPRFAAIPPATTIFG